MWVITGAFDAKERGDLSVQKDKLLKPGKKYIVGRKATSDLFVNSGKVSSRHAEVIVGEYTPEDAANPSFVPTLRVTNLRDDIKGMIILRDNENVIVNPAATMELHDGDVVHPVTDAPLTVKWQRVCCYAPATKGKSSVSVEACVGLGISVVHTSHADITHHLSSSFSLTVQIATSLLCASHIVRPEWLDEVIRIGDLPKSDPISLECTFALPLPSKFRPTFSPSLPSALKAFRVWEPNEERLQMFRGFRFIFARERGSEVPGTLRDLVSNGGGQYEAFAIDSGRTKLHQLLAKGMQRVSDGGKGLVLVAEEEGMVAAVGKGGWEELVEEARSYELEFVPPDNLVKAVVYTDVSYLKHNPDSGGKASPPPASTSNTQSKPSANESSAPSPSQPAPEPESSNPPRRRLVRRAASASSRAPSPGPSAPPPQKEPTPEVEQAPPPKRMLTRRAGGRAPLINFDDDSEIIDSAVVASVAAKPVSTRSARSVSPSGDSNTQSRSSRLKRRAGQAISSLIVGDDDAEGVGKEPPLKKFRTLFDESDPSKLSGVIDSQTGANQDEIYSMLQSQTQSVTQTDTQSKRSGTQSRGKLAVVAEEEEMSAMSVEKTGGSGEGSSKEVQSQVGKTRTAETSATSVTEPSGSSKPKSAVQIPMTNSIKQSQKSGAAPGQPDTDEGFLKAVASKKKGKRSEDTFDREFNNLRISKPDLNQQQHQNEDEREWDMMRADDFGDYDVRGNFMVVVEMEVPERRREGGLVRGGEGRVRWEGRNDFKKFKHKMAPRTRARVELVISEGDDYGMGTSYWKGSQSQSQSQPLVGVSPPSPRPVAKSRAKATRKRAKTPNPVEDLDIDDDDFASLPPSRAKSQQPLFLPESQDDYSQMVDIDPLPDESQGDSTSAPPTLRSVEDAPPPPAKPPSRKRKTPAVVVVDDDSDDGATFKGFKGRKKAKVK